MIFLYLLMLFYQTGQFVDTHFFFDKINLTISIITVIIWFCVTNYFLTKKSVRMYNFLRVNLILAFVRLNFFQFFILFELSILPIFFIIFHQGKQIERLNAGVYMIIYTLLSSTPLLVLIFQIKFPLSVWRIRELSLNSWNFRIIFMIGFLAFLTKLPIFTLHIWLPKAHVEAPIYGSIVLARVMLKLGAYGLIKVLLIFWTWKIYKRRVIGFLILGRILPSIICVFSGDLKVLIALSSVGHMTFLVSSIFFCYIETHSRFLILTLTHGFISSNIFYLLNCSYERTHTRRFFFNKVHSFCGVISSFVLIIMSINLGVPPFSTFFREMEFCISFFTYRILLILPVFFHIMIRTVYSLLFFYNFNSKIFGFNLGRNLNVREWVNFFILSIFLFMITLNVRYYRIM